MSDEQALRDFLGELQAAARLAQKAEKAKKSLSAQNFYAKKFDDFQVRLLPLSSAAAKVSAAHLSGPEAAAFTGHVNVLRSTTATSKERNLALRDIRLLIDGLLIPKVAALGVATVPAHDGVLASAVVAGTRGYLEHVVLQANGAYEQGWYDASAVMIRKLIEILIIEVYEAKGRAVDVKHPNGDFFMLGDLVDFVVADKTLNLARENRATLPKIKALGDRSAHNRRYLARKSDVDKVVPGLRVVVDDFLHLAGLR